MARPTAEVVICGAGIAGISAAYHLAVRRGISGVVLVDERPPLTLTSDKSTEAYRNWWPGPGEAMVRLMDRSIDLLEELAAESDNAFALNHNAYAYFTARPEQARAFEAGAREISRLGAGPLRVVRGAGDPELPALDFDDPAPGPGGADLVLDRDAILAEHPFLSPDVVAMLRPRRCGWLAAQQLGMWLLERAQERGVRLLHGRVEAVETQDGRVVGVRLAPGCDEEGVATGCFVDAAGPMVGEVGRMLGVELPVFHELHAKVTFTDHLGVLPRELPLMIWSDPVTLAWSEEERALLDGDPEMQPLRRELPGGLHFRPEGGPGSRAVIALWAYHVGPVEPRLPPVFDPLYAQVVLAGMARMVPAMEAYAERARTPYVDGGYYCKTRENRPLIGPLPVAGAWVLGALSGYGVMASQGAAELLAAQITGGEVPGWASAFRLERYDDPEYQKLLAGWDAAAGEL